MGSVAVVPKLSCPEAGGLLPGQGLNHSPALAGGFFATGPPGKSHHTLLNTPIDNTSDIWITMVTGD